MRRLLILLAVAAALLLTAQFVGAAEHLQDLIGPENLVLIWPLNVTF